jgi:hypothetical protein
MITFNSLVLTLADVRSSAGGAPRIADCGSFVRLVDLVSRATLSLLSFWFVGHDELARFEPSVPPFETNHVSISVEPWGLYRRPAIG